MGTKEISYAIIECVGTISKKNGYSKEVNLISWAGREPVYDIRGWRTDKDGAKQPLKGISMSKDDLSALNVILSNIELEV